MNPSLGVYDWLIGAHLLWIRAREIVRSWVRALGEFMDAARRALLEKAFRRRAAYKRLFLDENGNLTKDAVRFFDHLYREARVLAPAMNPNAGPTDPIALGYRNGQRDLVMIMVRELEAPLKEMADALLKLEEEDRYV